MDLLTVQRNLIKAQQNYVSVLSEQNKVTDKIYKSNDEEIEDTDTKEVPQKDYSASIGKNLQNLRKKAGYTQVELAQAVNVNKSMIGLIETGRKLPSLILAVDIAKTLGCTIEEMCKD